MLLQEERLIGEILIGLENKKDLHGALHSVEFKALWGLNEIKSHHWRIVWCSAAMRENVIYRVNWLLQTSVQEILP